MTVPPSKALIIGAGLSGLACALILAKHGYQVTVCESAAQPGQTLRGFTRQGIYFDTGLHYTGGLGLKGVLRPYLNYLGVDGLELIPFKKEGFDSILFPTTNQEIHLPIGIEALRDSLLQDFPAEQQVIDEYLTEAQAAYHSSVLLPFEESLKTAQNNPEWHISLDEFLAKRTTNKQLKCVLSIHCLLHGIAPSATPFLQHARVAASYFEEVHTVKGGGKYLIQKLVEQLLTTGGTLHTSSEVEQCLSNDGKTLCGVRLSSGKELFADTVIYTGHPSLLPPLIPSGLFRPVFNKRLLALQDTVSAHILFGISPQSIPTIQHKNLFICPDTNLEPAFTPYASPADGPFYLTASPQNDNAQCGVMALAPSSIGHFAQWGKSSVRKRPPEYYQHKEALNQSMVASIQKYFPPFQNVRVIDSSTPLTLRDYLGSPQGGLYGAAHSITQFCPLPVTKIPNLLLAGQSIIAPGILGAIVSSFLSCGFIVGQQKLLAKVKQCQ